MGGDDGLNHSVWTLFRELWKHKTDGNISAEHPRWAIFAAFFGGLTVHVINYAAALWHYENIGNFLDYFTSLSWPFQAVGFIAGVIAITIIPLVMAYIIMKSYKSLSYIALYGRGIFWALLVWWVIASAFGN